MSNSFYYKSKLFLIQSIPLFDSDDEVRLTAEDLPNGAPLLIYSAPVVPDTYCAATSEETGSFILSKPLYNAVNKSKEIESCVTVSYLNAYNRYKAMSIAIEKRSIFSVIGRFMFSKNKKLHLVASDIEWNQTTGNPQSSKTFHEEKTKSQENFGQQLESLDEKYLKMGNSKKKRRMMISPSKQTTETTKNSEANNLVNAIEQVKNKTKSTD